MLVSSLLFTGIARLTCPHENRSTLCQPHESAKTTDRATQILGAGLLHARGTTSFCFQVRSEFSDAMLLTCRCCSVS